jgi:hypothetical protein
VWYDLTYVVGVVKWLRHRIVIPACVGSNPTTHPLKFNSIVGVSPSGKAMDSDSIMRRFESCYPSQRRHGQVVRQRSAKPLSPSSNLGVASILNLLKQLCILVRQVFLYIEAGAFHKIEEM